MISHTAGTPRRRVRLMLVDDHEVVRQGVRSLIESVPDWTLCAEAAGSEEALKLAADAKPDIVVVDVSMPNVSVKTVETHRSAAMRKIGAKSSADLALYAARNELVQL